ncbi:MAG: hypothetical protein HYZ81_10625 [Nitrospinae bacterium]|nr:hypothetical protein [Nitrospinota bacterium]
MVFTKRCMLSLLIQVPIICVSLVLLWTLPLWAAAGAVPLSPPQDLQAHDWPSDAGQKIYLTWKAMPYDGETVEYVVYAAEDPQGPFADEVIRLRGNQRYMADVKLPFWTWRKRRDVHLVAIDAVTIPKGEERRKERLQPGKPYFFKLVVTDGVGQSESPVVSAISRGNLFNWNRLNNFLYMLLFSVIILWFISRARRRELFLRRIPGLNAVEEAIGRATEMGRPIYYLTGRDGISSISTIAATVLLGEIAKKAAAYDARIKVPHTDPIVMAVSQEIVKQAYTQAGRPDAYQEDINFFVTDDQFGYAAAVDGLMVRERPAACFYMGYYYAEALLLTETGASTGAIQIAGTDAEHQLPFFVSSCDYTLIGEELYAASAYLSRDPVLVGTLRGQDVGKAFLVLLVVLGVLLVTLGTLFGFQELAAAALDLFRAF